METGVTLFLEDKFQRGEKVQTEVEKCDFGKNAYIYFFFYYEIEIINYL